MKDRNKPLVSFFNLTSDAPPPTKADDALGGAVPLRAYRYCDPLVRASGFGWHMYAPIDFSVAWDGYGFKWTVDEAKWYDLENAQMPGLMDHLALSAPPEFFELAPPFLSALPETGVLQVWSGYFAKTRPRWSLLVRGPANLPGSPVFETLEGIVETDWWVGPIFGNLSFRKTNTIVRFSRNRPLFLIQPIPQIAYSTALLDNFSVKKNTSEILSCEWNEYAATVLPGSESKKTLGGYAKIARRRRSR